MQYNQFFLVNMLLKLKETHNGWSGKIRDWDHVKDVLLNPDKQKTEKHIMRRYNF